MTVQDNLNTVREVYDALVKGDVEYILGLCTDDVDWAADTTSTVAPWYGVRRGKAEVAEFFQQFDSAIEVLEWTVIAMAADDSEVFARVAYRGRARHNGEQIAANLMHYFKFRDGMFQFWRGSEDTAQVEHVFA